MNKIIYRLFDKEIKEQTKFFDTLEKMTKELNKKQIIKNLTKKYG